MWKNFVRDYLSFSRSQRRGLFILGGIILACKMLPLLFPYFTAHEEDTADFEKAVTDFLALQKSPIEKKNSSSQKAAHLFYFDPNTLSIKDWQRLGVSLHTATTIQHYRQAGGRFYKKEDLKKIYGLSEKTYRRLAPYIRIIRTGKSQTQAIPEKKIKRQTTESPEVHHPHPVYKRNLKIDINEADSTTWSRLYGIGPVLSARIVRFRKALGGFYKIEQIKEVYGLPDSTFRSIRPYLNISKVFLKKLNINKASVDELKSHPYINFRLAAAIKAFREMHGTLDSLSELKRVQLVDDEIYRKLAPYLTVK